MEIQKKIKNKNKIIKQICNFVVVVVVDNICVLKQFTD